MDLARQALDVTPWRPEEYERARAVLRRVMAESGSAEADRSRWGTRIVRGARVVAGR